MVSNISNKKKLSPPKFDFLKLHKLQRKMIDIFNNLSKPDKEEALKQHPELSSTHYIIIGYISKLFPDFNNDEHWKFCDEIESIIHRMSPSPKERMDFEKSMKSLRMPEYIESLNILKKLRELDILSYRLNVDEESISQAEEWFTKKTRSLSSRLSENRTANYYLGLVYDKLCELGWGHNKQIDFIFKLYKYFNIDDYGKGIYLYEQKERIRKNRDIILKGKYKVF